MNKSQSRMPTSSLLDDGEMRTFCASCGIRESTIEAAIKVRRAQPERKPSPLKGRKRNLKAKARSQS